MEKNLREIMVKKPFLRVSYEGGLEENKISGNIWASPSNGVDGITYIAMTQADFLRMFFPEGHKINDPMYYKDKLKYDEKKDKWFVVPVVRCLFPFQVIITIKHLCHLCGNDIQFELSTTKEDEKMTELFFEFCQGWLQKNMEVAWYEAAKSAKVTGDCAIVFFIKDKKLYTKNLSFLNRDVLYPHYDSITGKLTLFARAYSDYDKDNNEITRWCEVWDDTYMYTYREDTKGMSGTVSKVKEFFGLSGYSMVGKPVRHEFSSIPVAYHRVESGACWIDGQDSIDQYEFAVSHLCQNNMAYAFPIMYLKGDDIDIESDVYGSVKAITMQSEGDAGFLSRPDASASFELQLKILLQNIFMGTFTVLPPEVKSGDLPGVAIKLLFSPAVEKATSDAKEFNPFIDKVVELFKEGYGLEMAKLTTYKNLPIFGWIKPYVHQNESELFTNMSTGVQNGYLSKQSASQMASTAGYGQNNEWDRIMIERKREQQEDLLVDLKRQEEKFNLTQASYRQTPNNEGRINVNPGNKRVWDENGNWPGRNNWDEWNKKH